MEPQSTEMREAIKEELLSVGHPYEWSPHAPWAGRGLSSTQVCSTSPIHPSVPCHLSSPLIFNLSSFSLPFIQRPTTTKQNHDQVNSSLKKERNLPMTLPAFSFFLLSFTTNSLIEESTSLSPYPLRISLLYYAPKRSHWNHYHSKALVTVGCHCPQSLSSSPPIARIFDSPFLKVSVLCFPLISLAFPSQCPQHIFPPKLTSSAAPWLS